MKARETSLALAKRVVLARVDLTADQLRVIELSMPRQYRTGIAARRRAAEIREGF